MPEDSAPLRNLSAALYELGKYKESALVALKALRLLETESPDDMPAQVQKLKQRVQKAKAHECQSLQGEQRQRRLQIIDDLPRYRPSMFIAAEYFTVGHDVVTSLFGTNNLFEKMSPELKNVSFFLGGVGDSRNALQTMCALVEYEQTGKMPERSYHFTLNDIQKSAIARDLIIWMLLDELSLLNMASDEADMILNTVSFVYLSTMMPRYAFDYLNVTIDKALKALEAKQQPLKWLHLYEQDMSLYVTTLRHWKDDVSAIFAPGEIMTKVSRAMLGRGIGVFDDEEKLFCKAEQTLYGKTAFLFPSAKVLRRQDPKLLKLLKSYSACANNEVSKIADHMKTKWYLNTTLMDKQWHDGLGKDKFDVGFDPHQSIRHFPYDEVSNKSKNPKSLFDHMTPFFVDVAKAIKYLSGRLKFEAILGDYADVAERI